MSICTPSYIIEYSFFRLDPAGLLPMCFDRALEARMQKSRRKEHPKAPHTVEEMEDIVSKYEQYG